MIRKHSERNSLVSHTDADGHAERVGRTFLQSCRVFAILMFGSLRVELQHLLPRLTRRGYEFVLLLTRWSWI